MAKHFLIGLSFALVLNYAAGFSEAQSWKTGSSFRKALNQKTKFLSNGGLQDGLTGLSQNSRVAIFLDRDVDPSQKAEFPSELQPLGKTLDEVAADVDALALSVGSFVYLVPHQKALRFLVKQNIQASQLEKYSTSLKQRLKQVSELQWPVLTTPRDLVSVMASNLQLEIKNPEMIPHDLWNRQDLPRLPKWEQLTLLLSCMNRTFVIDENAKSITIIRFADEQVLTLKFRRTEQRQIEQAIRQLKLARIQSVLKDSDFYVRGPHHELVQLYDSIRPIRKWNSSRKAGSQDVFDLKTNASRGSILATIARNQGIQLKFGAEANDLLRQKISINVKDVSIESLIQSTLKGSGLRFRLTETELIISK